MNARIAALLLGLVSMTVFADSTKLERTLVDASTLAYATESLVKDIGTVPAQIDWPIVLLQEQEKYPTWNGPYIANTPQDQWNNHYQIKITEKALVGVYSLGANGLDEQGGGDDVTSWGGYDKNIYHPDLQRRLVGLWIAVVLMAFFIFFTLWFLSKRKN